MNSRYPSSVARNAAVILSQLAGKLVVIYLNLRMTQRILAIYNPDSANYWHPEFDPVKKNMLLIWDAGYGGARWLPLDRVTHIVAGGRTYRAQQAGRPLPSPTLYHIKRIAS